jgi:GNAT superfamily N-acetyltransferase
LKALFVAMVEIRSARAEDEPFLEQMLAIAADWQSDTAGSRLPEVLADPTVARYLEGWPRDRDYGVVAEDARPLGAAWWHFFAESEPGYGFVDACIPELAVGIIPDRRREGIGSLLLNALLTEARIRELRGISLSVARENPAVRLYERLGFRALREEHGSVTMLATLDG